MIVSSAPRAATAARGDREVAKPPSGTRGSRRLPKGKDRGTVRLPAYTKHTKRSRAATCTGDCDTEVAAHAPEDRLWGQVSWLFREKTRVLRRSGVIDRSPMMAFEERHLGRHRCLSMPSTKKIHRNPLNCGTRMLYLWFNGGIVYSMLGNINHLTHIIKHILLSGHDLCAGFCCV